MPVATKLWYRVTTKPNESSFWRRRQTSPQVHLRLPEHNQTQPKMSRVSRTLNHDASQNPKPKVTGHGIKEGDEDSQTHKMPEASLLNQYPNSQE